MTTTKKLSSTENYWNTKDKHKFIVERTGINYDDWQWEYAETPRDTSARIGRQSGKSEGEALRLGKFSLDYKPPKAGLHLLITGSVERQAYELFMKVRRFIEAVAPSAIKGRPTMRKLELKSGLTILSLPAGNDGAGLRNYACAKIAFDEAHYINDEVFVALRPMLISTGGTMDLMSTTRGSKGFFRETFEKDSGFTNFHFKTYDVLNKRKICSSWTEEQRKFALSFLEIEQKRMTKLQYQQEYEAEFLDNLQQFFPMDLIKSCIGNSRVAHGRNYLGIDFAGYGGDQNAFVTLENEGKYSFIKCFETTEKVRAWETVQKILNLDRQYLYKEIGVDDGGLGTPILDYMLTHNTLKRKSIGLNNASRQITQDGRSKRLLKEDMYGNLKIMMEQGLINFKQDEDLIRSLISIQFEIDEDTKNVKIFGKYSHITEGLIRAAWLVKSKSLNCYVHFF